MITNGMLLYSDSLSHDAYVYDIKLQDVTG